MLTVEQAMQELKIAVENNPGPWEQHSLVAAENARLIAEKVPGMDPEKAAKFRAAMEAKAAKEAAAQKGGE